MFDDQRAGTHVTVNPQVLHESIDGEVIAIDLATGNYYSLRGSGADIWRIADGRAVETWVQMDMLSLMQQLGAIPHQTRS